MRKRTEQEIIQIKAKCFDIQQELQKLRYEHSELVKILNEHYQAVEADKRAELGIVSKPEKPVTI